MEGKESCAVSTCLFAKSVKVSFLEQYTTTNTSFCDTGTDRKNKILKAMVKEQDETLYRRVYRLVSCNYRLSIPTIDVSINSTLWFYRYKGKSKIVFSCVSKSKKFCRSYTRVNTNHVPQNLFYPFLMAGYGKRPTKTKFIMFCILNFSRGSLDYEEELSVVFFFS